MRKVGVLLILIGMLFIGFGSSFEYNSSNTSINGCGNITESGTYTLQNNISNGTSDCLIVSADDVTINGAGFTITGNVNGTNGIRGYSFNLTNMTLFGNVETKGADAEAYTAGNGGTISLSFVNLVGNVDASGGVGDFSGNGGIIFLNYSNVTGNVFSIGPSGITYGGNGGSVYSSYSNFSGNINVSVTGCPSISIHNSGLINLFFSNAINLSAYAGECSGTPYIGGNVFLLESSAVFIDLHGGNSNGEIQIGSAGGNATIINSSVTKINSYGGIGIVGGSGGNLTITNSYVTTINVSGQNSVTGSGGIGGFVTLTNSNATTINTIGGNGLENGGAGGSVTITNSNVTTITTIGGGSNDEIGGAGGNVTITSSTVTTITTTGGVGTNGNGGTGGSVTITNSTTGAITTTGETGGASGDGGLGGSVTITNSTTGAITTTGGAGGGLGGAGGSVTITNSTTGAITTTGEIGGAGGSVTITNSITGAITTTGGTDIYGGTGGVGGNVTIINSNLNLTNLNIRSIGGSGGENGTAGTLKLNQTTLYNGFGAVKFSYVSTNETNFTKILNISKNLAYVNSSNYVAYNVSANVTLLDTNVTGTDIFKDGVVCSDCAILSAVGDDYIFNVTSWSNYSIADASDPVVYLFQIANSTSLSRTIYYNVSDDSDIANCSIYFEGVWHHSNTTVINKSANNSFNWASFAVGNHVIMVSCEDVYGNIGNSSNVTFSVTQETIADDSSSGSGGGSTTYTILQTLLESGFSRNVGKNYVLRFIYANQTHTITFNNLSSDSITFTVASTPQTFSLKINESVLVDIEKDGVYDLNVTYNKYSGTMANVSLKNVSVAYTNAEESEEIEEDKTVVEDFIEETSGSLWKFVFNLIVLIAIIVLVIILSRRLGRHIKRRKR